MQSKKQLIVHILNLLNAQTDQEHPMTQTALAAFLSRVFPCDRKTVCRNIRLLQEMGYPIRKTPKGFYMDRKVFSVEEVRFAQEAIRGADGKGEEEKEALAERVGEALSKMYRWQK